MENKTIDKVERWVDKLLWFLAIGSGILSYIGMYSVAKDAGFGYWSYLWPLVTESAVVIFSLVLLDAKLRSYKNNWLMPIIILCTVLSSTFNMYHSPEPDWFTRFVWALPPVFLFVAFKTWIWKIEQDVKTNSLIKSNEDLGQEISHKQNELVSLSAQLEQTRIVLNSQPELTDKDKNKIKLHNYLQDNPYATQEAMMDYVGVKSRPTIKTYLDEMNYIKNGHGWEIATV